jgi:lipoic acid synthetase
MESVLTCPTASPTAPRPAGIPLRPRLPEWLKVSLPTTGTFTKTRTLLDDLKLHTVCESAKCPNHWECWSKGTATFMIAGDRCTRACGFCAVSTAKPLPLENDEPERVAEAARRMALKHVVITAVARDDLADGGAEHFRKTIEAVRASNPGVVIEVLVPDFLDKDSAIDAVLDAAPDVYNHNLETVRRLTPSVRHRATYDRSLAVLAKAKNRSGGKMHTKSGLMLGLGEQRDEVIQSMRDLRASNVDILTLGQYLQPTLKHLPVVEFIRPEVFAELGALGRELGFVHVASGPLVPQFVPCRRVLARPAVVRRQQGLIRGQDSWGRNVRAPMNFWFQVPQSTALVATLAAGCASTAAFASPLSDSLEAIRARHHLPALACAVIRSNSVVDQAAVGLRAEGRTNAVTVQDAWHLGSVTKSMTATLAAVLVEEGRLHWTDQLGDAFPTDLLSVDPAWRNVTLEQLLGNRGGAPDQAWLDQSGLLVSILEHPREPRGTSALFSRGKSLKRPPPIPTGTRFVYSNAGFILAGVWMEQRLGARVGIAGCRPRLSSARNEDRRIRSTGSFRNGFATVGTSEGRFPLGRTSAGSSGRRSTRARPRRHGACLDVRSFELRDGASERRARPVHRAEAQAGDLASASHGA